MLEFPAPNSPSVVTATLRLEQLSDLVPAVDRCRRLLDADADPLRVDEQLAKDLHLADSVRDCPGLRVPGAVDGPEILLRAMFGQQVSVASARTTLGRLTADVGRPLDRAALGPDPHPRLTHLFPEPAELAELDPARIPGPRRRAEAVVAVNTAIAGGELRIDAGRRSSELTAELIARPGIGPWTAQYVTLRVLGDPDVLMTGDLVLRQGAALAGLPTDVTALEERARIWSPFRSYAALHLWRIAATQTSKTTTSATKGLA